MGYIYLFDLVVSRPSGRHLVRSQLFRKDNIQNASIFGVMILFSNGQRHHTGLPSGSSHKIYFLEFEISNSEVKKQNKDRLNLTSLSRNSKKKTIKFVTLRH